MRRESEIVVMDATLREITYRVKKKRAGRRSEQKKKVTMGKADARRAVGRRPMNRMTRDHIG
jgi:hypothetical protein